jgi:hypothetical protein
MGAQQLTRAERELTLRSHRRRCEDREPTAARAVLAYLDRAEQLCDGYSEPNRKDKRRAQGKPRGHRHPGKRTRRQRELLFRQPDFSERSVQEINRLTRQEIERAPEGDGLIAGPLAVAARYAAPQLVAQHGLDPDEHTEAVAHWLIGTLGEIIHGFDPAAYLRWREDCMSRIAPGASVTT